ncbi:MAG: intersectin-EH binding protein Ibp1 [Mycobacterium sp.]|nr:intersectin-EH binding protein Ibp1 [Mycobacterium sp.]
MATLTNAARRCLLAGGFAFAAAAAPLTMTLSAQSQSSPSVAYCPPGEVENAASGACKPITDQPPTTLNPIDPEKNPFQPGEITSSRTGNVGELPEINGIPCNSNHSGGGSTGECIGLEQEQSLIPTLKPPIPVVSP